MTPLEMLLFLLTVTLTGPLYRLYRNRQKLEGVPGPLIASLTDVWFFLQQRRGKSWNTLMTELHEKYGPVVRYGPHRLSFTDPAAIGVIYGFHPLLHKRLRSDNYSSLTKVSNGQEVISFNTLLDEKRHTAIKKYIGPAFILRTVQEYESMVDGTIELLIQQLRKRSEVDVSQWMEYFATDTICRIAFNEDANCLRTGTDPTGFIATATERFTHWTYWSILPDCDRMIFRNPVVTQLLRQTSTIAAKTAQKVKSARERKEVGNHPDLIGRFLAASNENPQAVGPQDVTGLVMSIMTAGASTTGYTSTLILYHLIKSPRALVTLKEELTKARAEGRLSDPPRFEELNKLKYLDAVIKESMRLTPTTDHGIWRVAPPSGIEVAGVLVPAGTVMEIPMNIVQRNKDIFGVDSDIFRPERWLQATDQQKIKMEKTWLAFGAGKRVCLGQNIAMLEMKKLIPRLVTVFEMSLVDPAQPLKMSGMFVTGPVGLKMRFASKTD